MLIKSGVILLETKSLREEISELISLGTEGDYWDFKQEWHDNNSDLLIDIICMANNLVNRDAYIIIGVAERKSENGVEVVGVQNCNRKTQQNLIDFLKEIKFAGDIRPTVYVRKINHHGKELDVIIIKNSTNTPYYLSESYQGVYNGKIYTRVGDTNTPKKTTADIDKVEYLWRKRFSIDLLPMDKVKVLLQNPRNWLPIQTQDQHSGKYYCKQHPEFTITYQMDENRYDRGRVDKVDHDIYWLNALPRPLHNVFIYNLTIHYHSTGLFWTLAVAADNYRFERTLWKRKSLFDNPSLATIFYIYIEKDSIEFLLDEWLCNKQETVRKMKELPISCSLNPEELEPEYSCNNPYNVVPVFNDAKEHEEFREFINSRRDDLFATVGDIESINTYYADPDRIYYLCAVGSTLVKWLEEWRSHPIK